MRQRSLDEMITYFNQEIDKMEIDRRYKIALLGMVTAIGCTAKQTIEDRKNGEWLKAYGDHESFGVRPFYRYCSKCNESTVWAYNFCPNCGADMRGGDDE